MLVHLFGLRPQGSHTRFCGVAIDITKLKRVWEMQAAIAREEETPAVQRATPISDRSRAVAIHSI